jgi:hypothetical protein
LQTYTLFRVDLSNGVILAVTRPFGGNDDAIADVNVGQRRDGVFLCAWH